MKNTWKQKECGQMLYVSGMLDKLANFGELEVLTTEANVSFLTGMLDKFGMEYKVELTGEEVSDEFKNQPEPWSYYRILMKDSMWGDWATADKGADTE